MSLFRHNSALQSVKYIQRKKRVFIISITLIFFCLLLFILNILLFSRLPFIQISTINIESSNHISKEEIEKDIFTYFDQKYFNIIPKSSIIFLSKNIIKQILLDKYKIINNLSIKRNGLSSITIKIDERTPRAIVCDGFRGDDTPDNCFFSDYKGYIYDRALKEDIENNQYNKYYVPSTNKAISAGISFIDEIRFNKIESFLSGIIQNGLSPLGVLIGENGEYEMYLKNDFMKEATTTRDITVYFDDKIPFENTLSNLVTFWKDAVIKNRNANAPVFDSINLHFGNTVYYSKQNNE